jgi:Glycosyltransferases involved in cell wall biogenesis
MQPVLTSRFSLVIPVYKNEESIPALIDTMSDMAIALDRSLELVFVVDGSPDLSYALLCDRLAQVSFPAKVVSLSRNFGAFAAVREGLTHATGEFTAVMAADLQEPPEFVVQALRILERGDTDVVFGIRESRDDPWSSRVMAAVFWWVYRRFVQRDMPPGGVDVFAVNRRFRDRLIAFKEANTSLLGLLFWLGGRRNFVPYVRQKRQHGSSAWTFRKKFSYLLDSIFAFTDAPVRILLATGLFGVAISVALGMAVFIAKIANLVEVPGYAGTMLAVLLFGGLNALGLGLVGNYAWRAYENTKQRPLSIAVNVDVFGDQHSAPPMETTGHG